MALPLRYPQASPTALAFFDTTLELFSPFSQREIFFMTWLVGFGWRGGIALADLLRALRDRGLLLLQLYDRRKSKDFEGDCYSVGSVLWTDLP